MCGLYVSAYGSVCAYICIYIYMYVCIFIDRWIDTHMYLRSEHIHTCIQHIGLYAGVSIHTAAALRQDQPRVSSSPRYSSSTLISWLSFQPCCT